MAAPTRGGHRKGHCGQKRVIPHDFIPNHDVKVSVKCIARSTVRGYRVLVVVPLGCAWVPTPAIVHVDYAG